MRAKNCTVWLIVLLISQLMYSMDDQKIEIVIQVEQPKPQAAESTEQVDSPKPQTLNATELAKKAVHATLGHGNDYLERMLTRRIEGKKTSPKIIPIHRIPEPSSREHLRAHLAAETEKAQKNSLDLLSAQTGDATSGSEQNQTLTKWVLNAVLDEKLTDRTVRENSDYWKYINGALAIILPVITGLAQHYLAHNGCTGSN